MVAHMLYFRNIIDNGYRKDITMPVMRKPFETSYSAKEVLVGHSSLDTEI